MKNRLHVGQFMPSSVATVVIDNESLIKEYLEWKESYAQRASRTYAIWIRRFQELANVPPEQLTIGHWTGFARTLQGRFAPKCVEFALSIVHNYLRFWHEQGRLKQLPLYLARVPKAAANSHNAVTEDEYRRMISILKQKGEKGIRDLTIIMLLHDTGMRIGELARLEIEQIEEDASAVILTEKTIRRRQVFWNQDTDEVLQRYLVQRINRGGTSDWLFVRQGDAVDQPVTTRGLQHMMKAVCELAEIKRRLSPHSFRHAFIHRLAALGVPDAVLAQLVGHGSPFTISHYTKLSRRESEQFARKQFREVALAA